MMNRSIKSSDNRQAPFVYFDVEVDDAGLNPFEFRIYNRMARRAGGGDHYCTESLSSMVAGCQMSRSSVIRAIAGLVKRKMIARIRKTGKVSEYALLDKSNWPTGVCETLGPVSVRHHTRFPQTPHPFPTDTTPVSHRHPKNTKKKTIKETREDLAAASPQHAPEVSIFPAHEPDSDCVGKTLPSTPAPALLPVTKDHPAIQCVRAVTNRYPKKILWPQIADFLGEAFDPDRVRDCFRAWVARGFNEMNFDWLFEWYVSGIPQSKGATVRRQLSDAAAIENLPRWQRSLLGLT